MIDVGLILLILYVLSSVYLDNPEIESLYHNLCKINEKLWDIEDKLRFIEIEKRF